jgi:hypothetical protein
VAHFFLGRVGKTHRGFVRSNVHTKARQEMANSRNLFYNGFMRRFKLTAKAAVGFGWAGAAPLKGMAKFSLMDAKSVHTGYPTILSTTYGHTRDTSVTIVTFNIA